MPVCIHTTDADWISNLRDLRRGLKDRSGLVNFWRCEERNIRLEKGSLFYFRVNNGHTPGFISGRAQLFEIKTLSFESAWGEFKEANGVRSIDQLRESAERVLGIGPDHVLNCVLLRFAVFLETTRFIPLEKKEYSSAHKPYRVLSDLRASRIKKEFLRRLPNAALA
jgi:hypothetical protein